MIYTITKLSYLQRPVSVFEEEEDDEFESIALTEDSQWEVSSNGNVDVLFVGQMVYVTKHDCVLHSMQTLHDLMDESELESLSPTDATPSVSSADRKRRNLKENMRREAEARQKKKKELLMREQEYEKVYYIVHWSGIIIYTDYRHNSPECISLLTLCIGSHFGTLVLYYNFLYTCRKFESA